MNIPSVVLNSGAKMPQLGLGTWDLRGSECVRAVRDALDAGYRHVDTASLYGNEKEVGLAVKKSGVPRKDLFITSKIWNDEHDDPEAALEASLKRLGTDYVDLYLIHWPVPERNETWRAFEGFLKDKRCRSVGVSNFTVRHLKELLNKRNVVPAVNQIEFSPFLYQKDILQFCNESKIRLVASSPLTHGRKLKHAVIAALAKKYSKTPAQIVLRWHIQHGIVPIPKSKSRERIEENAAIFDFSISREDMALLDGLDEGYHYYADPGDEP
ncbi:MAG: aldo/keto reductase [Candidatus Aenigmarchaeota archaeon]|nr:aldo/keto reductase [Candidatus Aenigmarchaeota archaeon]